MTAEAIRDLQQKLQLIAAMDDSYLSLKADGVYGAKTADAVRRFQLRHGLSVSGEADEETVAMIARLYDDLSRLIADPHVLYALPSPYFTVGENDTGSFIWILQAVLTEIADGTAAPCPTVNGTYDRQTADCIRFWQGVLGLPTSGALDRFCWDGLADLYNMRLL